MIKYLIAIVLLPLLTAEAHYAAVINNDADRTISMSEPLYAPSHPYILAYAKTEGHNKKLYLLNQKDRSEVELSSITIASNGSLNRFFTGLFDQDKIDLDFYSGELHWRPVLDAKGRQWYVYIASTSTPELVLHFNYLNRDGTVSGLRDIIFSFQGEIRNPKWSNDGSMIAFSSRGQIFLVPDVKSIIASQDISDLVPVRLTQTGESNQYPDWSPSDYHIAYQSVRNETGVRNMGINIIQIDREFPSRSSAPVRVTSHLHNYNEYLPSWSPDENYIAYFINQDPLYLEQTSDNLDIGITQLFTNPGTGSIIGGRTGQTSARRIASNVKVGNSGGPQWLYLDQGNAVTLSLLFITADDRGNQRVRFARINEFLTNNSSTSYGLDDTSSLQDSYSVKSFTVAEIEKKLRVSQVVNNSSTPSLHAFERSANYSAPVIYQERERMNAIWRSALIPGFGQYHKGQSAKAGLFFGASALVASTNLYLFFIERPSLKSDRDNVTQTIRGLQPGTERIQKENQLRDIQSSLSSNKNMIIGGSVLFAGIWALNVIDSSLGFPITVRRQVNSGTISGEFGPRLNQGNPELGLSIQFDF